MGNRVGGTCSVGKALTRSRNRGNPVHELRAENTVRVVEHAFFQGDLF
jgi:hypothetical protein